MPVELKTALPYLLLEAIAWADTQAAHCASSGRPLDDGEARIARGVGVTYPERVRVVFVDDMPIPEDPALRAAALESGLMGDGAIGLTLGHSVFIRAGHETLRVLSHELRHVYQYEQAGSIAGFLPGYLQQIIEFGYVASPLEQDARLHEVTDRAVASPCGSRTTPSSA
jgi:hypothetical protein